jgi:hypothetical protein
LNLGKYTSRTLGLLCDSKPGKRNEVKILVYGQSISEQEWWLEVKRFVTGRFPDADIIMENKAVGGFSTEYLFKTAEMDISSFYPDLVILHVYGGSENYEKVLKTIRSRTTAEVAMMTDHYIGENRWSDTMSYFILPALAEKYHCDIINIRDPWKEYLKTNSLEPAALLRDGIHLNDYGNFLMAELVKPLFGCRVAENSDPLELEKDYVYGKDVWFTGDTLRLVFTGNRADLVTGNETGLNGTSLKILLDGKKPSSFSGTYYMTRPYSSNEKTWPWDLPAMIRIEKNSPWVEEEWTLLFTEAKPPYDDFSFRISGSVTGKDGKGRGAEDFVSHSGRVIIAGGDASAGGDWHLNRSYKVLKTIVTRGAAIRWRTYSESSDYITGSNSTDSSGTRSVIMFQGVPNTRHTLEIINPNGIEHGIKLIKTYRPPAERQYQQTR